MAGEPPGAPNGKAAILLSAVVPAYNQERNVRRLLGSLAEQKITRGALAEIVCEALVTQQG